MRWLDILMSANQEGTVAAVALCHADSRSSAQYTAGIVFDFNEWVNEWASYEEATLNPAGRHNPPRPPHPNPYVHLRFFSPYMLVYTADGWQPKKRRYRMDELHELQFNRCVCVVAMHKRTMNRWQSMLTQVGFFFFLHLHNTTNTWQWCNLIEKEHK